jgi:nucleoside-diphosphate-sugar epimerase
MMEILSFSGSKILVVGGAGFVGSILVGLLRQCSPSRVVIVDNLLSADISNVPEGDDIDFRYGSIADERILAALPDEIDFVFHLACYHGNQSSIADPLADHDNNTITTLKLLERLKGMPGLKKIVYAAAGCAVAEKTFEGASATKEDAPVSLFHDSPYSISKLVGEMYGNYYFQRYRLPFVKARFQNVYGPGEILGAGSWRGTPHTVWRNVTPTFIWKAMHREPLPVENGGIASRDFIYVDDLARGLMACAIEGEPGEIYNLASGVETRILQLAERVNALAGNPTPITLAPARDWDHSGQRFGDPTKARKRIGFSAAITHEEGLRRTIAWTRDNVDRITACMMKHARYVPQVRCYAKSDVHRF